MSYGYTVQTGTGAAVALVGTTAKTVVNVINAANKVVTLVEFGIFFDGVTATAVPVLVQLCSSTQATAGTSTSAPPVQIRGATRTVGATGQVAYTAEPTALTVRKHFLVPAFNGSLIMQFPLGREPQQTVTADGLCIRCTAPAAVNCRAYMEFEE